MGYKISIIVPVYNTPLEKLRRCILSILAIESVESEIIVVNDGSSRELCNAYEAYFRELNCKRIDYLYQNNMGVSAARNLGISRAKGEYVMLVDSDDEVIPEAFCDVYHADLVLFGHIFIKGRSRKRIFRSAIAGESREVPLEELAWLVSCGKLRGSCGLLYKREFLVNHGIMYEKGCIQGEDADFNFRVMQSRPTVQYFNKAGYLYWFSTETARARWDKMPESMIRSGEARFEQAIEVLRQFFPNDFESRKNKLVINRIHDLYRNAIELCGSGHATAENKRKMEQLMGCIDLPPEADWKTKRQYFGIVYRKWKEIEMIAKIRQFYLQLTGV